VSTNRPGDRPDASHDSTASYEDPARLTAWLTGDVQGVGMRWWIRARALELGLVGWAANRPDGRVEVVAEGERAGVESLLAQLTAQPSRTRPGRVTGVVDQWGSARGGLVGFQER
jgi:acylphosphatase